MPATGPVSWTVLGGDGAPLEPVETHLAYLAALERSPNTQRAYATSLKLWFEFLDAITAAETLGLDPASTREQLNRQKAIIERWTNLP